MERRQKVCKRCGEKSSWHEWEQSPYCSPYCKKGSESIREVKEVRKQRSDPERIISEYGAKELSKTREGVRVIERAAAKYKKELLQPGHPDFEREWGKDVRRRQEEQRELKRQSDKEWADRGGREKM